MQIRDFLNELGIPFAEAGSSSHIREGWIGLPCPWCGSQNWHLGYNLHYHYVSCWKCGRHETTLTLARLSNHTRTGDIREFFKSRTIARRAGDPTPHTGKYLPPVDLAFGCKLLPPHKEYLRGRGFDVKELRQFWDIGGIGAGGRLSWRIFIPIFFRGQPASWTTRSVSHNAHLRYINAGKEEEAIPKKKILYGVDYVRSACVAVEGYLDAWKIGPGAVAIGTTSYSREQMIQLARIPVRGIWFDNEPAAQQRARALADALAPHPGRTFIITSDSKDPGCAPKSELKRVRRTILED